MSSAHRSSLPLTLCALTCPRLKQTATTPKTGGPVQVRSGSGSGSGSGVRGLGLATVRVRVRVRVGLGLKLVLLCLYAMPALQGSALRSGPSADE